MKLQGNRNLSNGEIAEMYDDLFDSPGSLRDTDSYYKWVLNKIDLRPGQKLLDVACGEGILLKYARLANLQVVGIDLSLKGVSLAKNNVDSEVVAVANGERLPFENKEFDIVTNLGSLEHFIDPLAGVHEIKRVLRSSGIAALYLPNSYYLVDIVWHVLRTGYSVSHNQPLERFSTFREWWEFLESGGLKVERAYNYNFLFPKTREDWKWYFQHPKKFTNLIVSPFIPFNLSNHFLFICSVS